jgi:hypothetical protein
LAELVAKTASAVAVDEDLTVLIGWISIEDVSGFTIVVNNAGGGSADDVTDVQIDTAEDGGTTPSLDGHDGVPAVPIASGDAKQGTFTETAKFVRVRAKCAAGEDTTVTATLLADSATGRICTLADVKDRLGIASTDTGKDLVIGRIISGIGSLFDTFTGRSLIVNAADVTEYYKGLSSQLIVKRYPIVSITSIKEALDYDFDAATALVANTDYRLTNGGAGGILHRMYTYWPDVPDAVQIIYQGGYCSAGQTPGSGETAMPNDLREAAIEQASFILKRKDDIGLTSVGFEGGSINKSGPMKLLPIVEQTLKLYGRPQL